MSMALRWNTAQWNSARWNAFITSLVVPEFKILYNQRDVTVKWPVVTGATHYRYQVSLFPDFRSVFQDGLVISLSDEFTDMEADNEKRYWRWRAYSDSGITPIMPWSHVGSYWIDTAAANEIMLNRNEWMLVDPGDVDDRYLFELFPQYTIVSQNLYRIQTRNRLGDMLSEFLTIKDRINLRLSGAQYVDHQQFHEILRFHNDVRTVFLLTYKDTDKGHTMPGIWKAEFSDDLTFSMIAAGRQDLLRGDLNFEEV